MHRHGKKLQAFECEQEPAPSNSLPASRRTARVRTFDVDAPYYSPSFQFFDCEPVEVAADTPAVPRPKGKERRLSIVQAERGRSDSEQKVLSILLDSDAVGAEKAGSKIEYLTEYFAQGWKVKQLDAVSTGGAFAWIVVLMERARRQSRESRVES